MFDYKLLYNVANELRHIITDVFSEIHKIAIIKPDYMKYLNLYGMKNALIYPLSKGEDGYDLLALVDVDDDSYLYDGSVQVDSIYHEGKDVRLFIVGIESFKENTLRMIAGIFSKYILKDGGAPLYTPMDVINFIAVFYFSVIAAANHYSRYNKSIEKDIEMEDSSGEFNWDELSEAIINSVNNLLEVDKNVFISTIDAIKVIGEDNIKTILNEGYNASMYLYRFTQK